MNTTEVNDFADNSSVEGFNVSGHMGVSFQQVFYFYLWMYATPVCLVLIAVLGLFGNVLVIVAIVSRDKMRTVNNYLLLNLSCADILLLLINVPFAAYSFAADTWRLGELVCKASHYSRYVSVYVTVYTLVGISVMRYVTVVWSAATMKYRTKRNVLIFIVILWLAMLLLNVPYLLSQQVKCGDSGFCYCGLVQHHIKPLGVTFVVAAYAAPLCVIFVLYMLIIKHLHGNRSRMISGSNTSSRERTAHAYRVIVIVIVAFAVCWLPVNVDNLVKLSGRRLPNSYVYMVLHMVWFCLSYGNSCINPLIYNFSSQQFRECFYDLVCCKSAKKRRRVYEGTTNCAETEEKTTMI